MQELQIARAIARRYHEKFMDSLESDVLIAGAGPSGMLAARDLAKAGRKVVVIEKRLSPGGGVWGGGMAWNEVAAQEEAKPILEELGVRTREAEGGLYTADSLELASALCLEALRAGAAILNMLTVEDVVMEKERVAGVVVNRTGPASRDSRALIMGALPIDPLAFRAGAVLDATGHDAALARMVERRGFALKTPTGALVGEGAMDAVSGERFVVEKAGEAFPGLFVSGMAVCAVWGGPRMGPIFGGMLLSGRKVAKEIGKALG